MLKPNPLFKLSGLVCAVVMVMPLAAHAKTYTFAEAVDTVLNSNPEIEASNARIMQAESALGKAEASNLPQINLSVTGTYSNNPLNVFGMKLQQRQAALSDFGFDNATSTAFGSGNYEYEPDNLNHPDAHSDINTRIEMMIPIYNGGKVESFKQQAKSMIEAAQNGDVAVKQYLTFGVYQAYEAVHAARAFIKVAEQAKKTADEFVRTTENLVNQGVLVRSELLSAQVNASAAEVALTQAKGKEQIALDGLRILMGLNTAEKVDVANRMDIQLSETELEQVIEGALKHNPQLVAQRKQSASSVYAIEAAKADERPSFNMMVRQDWNDESIGLDASSYTVAGVFSWKITDFGLTKNNIKMAQGAALEKQAQSQSVANNVKFEAMTAWHRLQVAVAQVKSSKLAVEQAQEAQVLVTKRYENGVATFTELLASQTQLDKARADLVAAEFEVNVQKAKLRLATGTMDIAQL